MTEEQKRDVLSYRRANRYPLHRPPHYDSEQWTCYHLTAANYEHASIPGAHPKRMAEFSSELCDALADHKVYAWCVLPNHWHALVGTNELKMTLKKIGKLHGKMSFVWNKEDGCRGRKCWYGCADRAIRSERHFYATRNYIHHNPVKHGYVETWSEWVFSSAKEFLDDVGCDGAKRCWKEYPVLDMGKGWDD